MSKKKVSTHKRPRATKTEVFHRINWFLLRIGRGLSTSQLIEMAKTELGIEERQAYRYHKDAVDEIDQKGSLNFEKMVGRLLNEIDYALQKAYLENSLPDITRLLELRRKTIFDRKNRKNTHDESNTPKAGFTDQLEEALRALEGQGQTD